MAMREQLLDGGVALVEASRRRARSRGPGRGSAGSCRWSRWRSRRSGRGTRRRDSALDGISHIMTTSRPFSPRRRPFSAEQVDDALGLGDGAHERDHDLDVGQAHLVADEPHRLALHREAVGEAAVEVPRGAAEADHRVLFVRLVALAAEQAGVLVRLEVATCARSPARARRRRRSSRRPRRRAGRRSRAGRRTRRCAPRSRPCSVRARWSSSSSSALGWMPICRLMMNSSRARPTPWLGSWENVERLLRHADVHHDLDRDLGHAGRARSPRR